MGLLHKVAIAWVSVLAVQTVAIVVQTAVALRKE